MSITAERVSSMADVLRNLQDAAVINVGGNATMRDAKGRYVPLGLVKATDKLMDELVRKMIAFAVDLSAQIARFRGHSFDDLGSFQALLAQEHGAAVGGAKGNVTLMSFDGCMKVQFQVADLLDFGPELQAAKALVDECLTEWTEGSRDEVRAVVSRAFNVDREGRINRAELFMLLRVAIEEPRWKRAMEALRESIRVIGSKTYIRFYQRPAPDAKWEAVTIDLASAGGRA